MPWVTPLDELATSLEDSSNSHSVNAPSSTPNSNLIQTNEVALSATAPTAQDHESDLDQWLEDLGRKFKTLSIKERNQTLDYLIDISEGSQLYHLSERLHGLLKRDFLGLLPQDVVMYLVRFFGVETMITCSLVSKQWRDVIHSCNRAWKAAAVASGVNFEGRTFEKTCVLKESYLAASWYLKQLKAGTAFDTSVMYGHRDRIMTVYYHNGVIATGSDDHTVRLWNCTTGVCFRILHTHSTVAAVKFDESRIVTASFNMTATLWDLPTGEALKEYVGHVAAVFSVDYDAKLGVLVTGSADSTVKVWLLSCAVLIRTLSHHRSNWITQVCLHWSPGENAYSILSRDEHTIHMWRLTSGHDVISTKTQELTDPQYGILLSGWQVCGPLVTYTMHLGPKYTVIQLDLGKPDTPLSTTQFTYQDKMPQGFLGTGRQFTIILHSVDGSGRSSEMTVISNTTGETIATIPMPPNYRPSKRGSTFTLGERGWLDGFTSNSDLGVHLVANLRDNGIFQLRWRQLPSRPESDSDSTDE